MQSSSAKNKAPSTTAQSSRSADPSPWASSRHALPSPGKRRLFPLASTPEPRKHGGDTSAAVDPYATATQTLMAEAPVTSSKLVGVSLSTSGVPSLSDPDRAVISLTNVSDRCRAATKMIHNDILERARSTVLEARREKCSRELNTILRTVFPSAGDDASLLGRRGGRGAPSVAVPSVSLIVDKMIAEKNSLWLRAAEDAAFRGPLAAAPEGLQQKMKSTYEDHMASQITWLIQELGVAREGAEILDERYRLLLVKVAELEENAFRAGAKTKEAQQAKLDALRMLTEERQKHEEARDALMRELLHVREKLFAALEAQTQGQTAGPVHLPAVKGTEGGLKHGAPLKTRPLGGDATDVGGTSSASQIQESQSSEDARRTLIASAGAVSFEEKEKLLRQLVSLRKELNVAEQESHLVKDQLQMATADAERARSMIATIRRNCDSEVANYQQLLTALRDEHARVVNESETNYSRLLHQVQIYEASVFELQAKLQDVTARMLSMQNTLMNGPSVQTLLFNTLVRAQDASLAQDEINRMTEVIKNFVERFEADAAEGSLDPEQLYKQATRRKARDARKITQAAAEHAKRITRKDASEAPTAEPHAASMTDTDTPGTPLSSRWKDSADTVADAAGRRDTDMPMPHGVAVNSSATIADAVRESPPLRDRASDRGSCGLDADNTRTAGSDSGHPDHRASAPPSETSEPSPVQPDGPRASGDPSPVARQSDNTPLLPSRQSDNTPLLPSRQSERLVQPEPSLPRARQAADVSLQGAQPSDTKPLPVSRSDDSQQTARQSDNTPLLPSRQSERLVQPEPSLPRARQAADASLQGAQPSDTKPLPVSRSDDSQQAARQSDNTPLLPSRQSERLVQPEPSLPVARRGASKTFDNPPLPVSDSTVVLRQAAVRQSDVHREAKPGTMNSPSIGSEYTTMTGVERTTSRSILAENHFAALAQAAALDSGAFEECERLRAAKDAAEQRTRDAEHAGRSLSDELSATKAELASVQDRADDLERRLASVAALHSAEATQISKLKQRIVVLENDVQHGENETLLKEEHHLVEVRALHNDIIQLRRENKALSLADARTKLRAKEKLFYEGAEKMHRCLLGLQAIAACSICLENPTRPVVLVPCGHVVCSSCFRLANREHGITITAESDAIVFGPDTCVSSVTATCSGTAGGGGGSGGLVLPSGAFALIPGRSSSDALQYLNQRLKTAAYSGNLSSPEIFDTVAQDAATALAKPVPVTAWWCEECGGYVVQRIVCCSKVSEMVEKASYVLSKIAEIRKGVVFAAAVVDGVDPPPSGVPQLNDSSMHSPGGLEAADLTADAEQFILSDD